MWHFGDETPTESAAPETGISPEQFLAELETPDLAPAPADRAGPDRSIDESPAPWMPSPAEPWMRGSDDLPMAVPVDDAVAGMPDPAPPEATAIVPVVEAPGWAPPDGGQLLAPPPPDPLETGDASTMVVELDPDEERIRSVQAISSRIDADIRMGPTAHHRVVVSLVPAAAAIIVAIAGLLSYHNPPAERSGEVSSRSELGADAVLAFNDPGSAGTDRAAAASLVPMTVAGCGPIAEFVGIVVAPDRLIGRASLVSYDVRPVVTMPDGTVRMGTVIGLDRDLDLAVIELDPVIADATSPATTLPAIPWGSVDQLFSDPEVVVVEGHGSTATMIATRQVGIDGIVGEIDSFELEQTGFTPGAPVLNRRGLLIGLVDASGNHVTGGAELQRALGRLVLTRPMAAAACPESVPAPDPASDGEG